MLSRSAVGPAASRVAAHAAHPARPVLGCGASRRGFAAAAPRAHDFETGEAAGVRFASRELPGPVSMLSVVAKAGTRYQPYAGFSEVLDKYAFKSTTKRSALKITRESELLGGVLSAHHSRENVVLSAKFFSQDLPYFTELLSEVVSSTRYTQHELDELILPLIKLGQAHFAGSPAAVALDTAHSLAFHHGLGNAIIPSAAGPWKKKVSGESIAAFAQGAYAKPSLAIVGNGPGTTELSKWVGQFFDAAPASPAAGPYAPKTTPATYYGGETRLPSSSGNAVVFAFPGTSAAGTPGFDASVPVLASLLGGQSSIKWSAGSSLLAQATADIPGVSVSTTAPAYADAGLVAVTISGGNAASVAAASKSVAQTLQKLAAGDGVTAEAAARAAAAAKFSAISAGQSTAGGAELAGFDLLQSGKVAATSELASIGDVNVASVQEAAKKVLSGKASVVAVGDLDALPHAEELGLRV